MLLINLAALTNRFWCAHSRSTDIKVAITFNREQRGNYCGRYGCVNCSCKSTNVWLLLLIGNTAGTDQHSVNVRRVVHLLSFTHYSCTIASIRDLNGSSVLPEGKWWRAKTGYNVEVWAWQGRHGQQGKQQNTWENCQRNHRRLRLNGGKTEEIWS